MAEALHLAFVATDSHGPVSALWSRPEDARAAFIFGHGAGAGMRHAFMESVTGRLGRAGIATFRYHFPYMEAGRKAPDRAPVLMRTVRSAVAEAGHLAADLPLFAGGKSMGGRMTSAAAAEEPLPRVRGLGFFGFPLHAPGKPGTERGGHLGDVGLPMLFVSGDRDKLADLELLAPLLRSVQPAPTLHVVEGADHGFHVLKRSGRTDVQVLDEICGRFVRWVDDVLR
jgi:predicted alpha/beta-hydrolase family hydrolase